MEKRFFLTLLLIGLVIVVIPRLFPGSTARRPQVVPAASDSTAPDQVDNTGAGGGATTATRFPAAAESADAGQQAFRHDSLRIDARLAERLPAETTVVTTGVASYTFTNVGAKPLSTVILDYQELRGDSADVVLERDGDALLDFTLITARDTITFDSIRFTTVRSETATGEPRIEFMGVSGQVRLSMTYTFEPANYLVHVRGDVDGVETPAYLLISLPAGLESQEADTLDDQRHLGYAYKPRGDDASSISFDKLDADERTIVEGPLVWVAEKNKYFVIGLLAGNDAEEFSELHVEGSERRPRSKTVTRTRATVVKELRATTFAFSVYAGPQEWRRLNALGRDFANVNPTGGFMSGLIQPFATFVMQVLLWMKDRLEVNYGWILVLFGIGVRIILWPLNQRAMRSSLQMQQLQPELMAVQKKYASNQEKQREEMMRVYREHGASPLSPVMGCLPMLLPMPVLFALFFVFQNTIEFRGVSFLWLPDISLKDPYYIIPVLMGVSMFLLSWIGLRSTPQQSPQAKIMAYVLPVVMTVLFINFAAGLNLYYFVQNLAALPQQWLISRERARLAVQPASG